MKATNNNNSQESDIAPRRCNHKRLFFISVVTSSSDDDASPISCTIQCVYKLFAFSYTVSSQNQQKPCNFQTSIQAKGAVAEEESASSHNVLVIEIATELR